MVDLIGWVFGFFSAHLPVSSPRYIRLCFSIAVNLIPFFPTRTLSYNGVVLDEAILESYRSQPSRPGAATGKLVSYALGYGGSTSIRKQRGLTLSENSWAEALSG